MIEFNNPEHGKRIGEKVGIGFNPPLDVVIARTRGGELLGGVIIKDYTGVSAFIHVAAFSPNWMNKDFLWVVFDYPFNQLKIATLFGPIKESNSKALEFDLKLGFIPSYRIRDVYPDGDMILLSMKRDQCRWLQMPRPAGFDSRVAGGHHR